MNPPVYVPIVVPPREEWRLGHKRVLGQIGALDNVLERGEAAAGDSVHAHVQKTAGQFYLAIEPVRVGGYGVERICEYGCMKGWIIG